MKKTLILALTIDAGWIALGMLTRQNMWAWICLYWLINTFKNALDALEVRHGR